MIQIEKMGKPAIPIVSGRFEEDAIASSRALGMPDLQFVIVPRIYRNLPIDECVSQTEAAIDDIIDVLTVDQQHGRRERDEVAEVQRFEGEDRWDAILKMNEQWLMRDWGDSFVLHPPTTQAVDELIAGSNLDADELICDMPPGFGLATVEKIAINAAMAGAKPEHMPVIIASVKALSQMGSHGGTSLLMSTSPQAPLLVVNGPIAKELGINARSALGPGRDNQVNITIGRAFSLCLRNIGYWYPGQMDMDTIGTTRKFVHCIAENEDMSPWEPFHVNQGFRASESTVSVFITNGELDVQDQGNTNAEALLKTLAYGSIFGTRGLGMHGGGQRLILMPPDVAGPVGDQGFTKDDARTFIHHHAKNSLGKMIQYTPIKGEARIAAAWRWLENLTEQEILDIEVSVLDSPEDWNIVVVGADRAKTAVMPTTDNIATVGIDQYRT
ncbi:MAG: hypothetical protein F4Y63_00300 [Chloroflexi bacterium]|nr:hypothetical protein [Chloroflexota bacterium]MYK62548.1 hypothetical protein [Chloroflexota bacterium]